MLSLQVALGFSGSVVQAGFRCAGLNGLGTTWANLARLAEALAADAAKAAAKLAEIDRQLEAEPDLEITWIGPHDTALSEDVLANAVLYAQPGGNGTVEEALAIARYNGGVGACIDTADDAGVIGQRRALAGWDEGARERDLAILTVIGFSMNDTVIVFDRIREYFRTMKNSSKEEVINKAINDTLSRTIMTWLTVFLTILILFLVGGEVTKGFAFAMLIGVVTGTYSSIFVAAPILMDFAKNKALGDATDIIS